LFLYNYISLYIIIYEQFFSCFFNLTFCKRNNAKIILLIIFCVIIILLFFLYQTVILQSKKVYINLYGHISYIIIYRVFEKKMGFSYDLQKYAFSEEMTRIKVAVPDLKTTGNFTLRYFVMSVIKVTSKGLLEIKLMTVTEYAMKDSTEKMTRIKVVEIMKDYLLVNLSLNLALNLTSIWVQIQSIKARSIADSAS